MLLQECIALVYVFLVVDVGEAEPEEATGEIGDTEHNHDKPEYLVVVHEHVLSLDSICTSGLIKILLNHFFDSRNIKQLYKF